MYMPLLLSRFSRIQLCVTPQMAAHQADSPGKNTGVGCHVLLQCMKVKSVSEAAQSCPTCSDPMNCSLPGSIGFSKARGLEWVAIAFSDICICYKSNCIHHHMQLLQSYFLVKRTFNIYSQQLLNTQKSINNID